ncbi:MAG: MBL fold metallo-hydrolase [Haloarculaceae archaeon]
MARQLADGVWLLDLGLVPPLATNAYLVDDALAAPADGDGAAESDGAEPGSDEADRTDGEVTLIDTGLFWNRASLPAELAAAGYAVADVDRVLLTHYDLDHTGGLSRIADDLDAPVYLGSADLRLVEGRDQPNAFHHKGLFHRIARRIAPLPAGLDVRGVDDGDRIGRFTAYHTPGHNPGHTAFVHDSGVAFLGDLVWEEDGEFTPPFWLDSYDMHELRESIRWFVAQDPHFEVACFGHGTPITSGGSEALQRLADRL